jgi:hypothetical protein
VDRFSAGISLKTLKRWMRVPEFVEQWRRARWEVVAGTAFAAVPHDAPRSIESWTMCTSPLSVNVN